MAIGYLKSREDELTDPNMGRMLFDQIDQAIQANNLEAVKAACRQLSSILPPDANSPLGGKISDVT